MNELNTSYESYYSYESVGLIYALRNNPNFQATDDGIPLTDQHMELRRSYRERIRRHFDECTTYFSHNNEKDFNLDSGKQALSNPGSKY